MGKLKWDQLGEKFYKTGVDHGILYPQKNGEYPKGVAWSGLTNVTKSPSGAEETALYADNIKYLSLRSAEQLGMTIECYMYPDEWKECNGETDPVPGISFGQQRRNSFGFAYRNKLGNDTEGEDYGFELNLIYGCSASPSEQSNASINDSPEAATFSYEVSTTPVNVSGKGPDGKPYKPLSSLTIDSTKIDPAILSIIEGILIGSDGEYKEEVVTSGDSLESDLYELVNGEYIKTEDTEAVTGKKYYKQITASVDPRLPLPDEIIKIYEENATLG